MVKVNVIQHGPVQLQNVGPAVVVIIDELHGHPAQPKGLVPDSRAKCEVIESSILVVVVQTIHFEIKVRDIYVLPAVAIHVRGVDPHSSLVAAVLARRHPGHQRNILKCSVVLINEQKIRPRIVGDGEVRPAVVVEIR